MLKFKNEHLNLAEGEVFQGTCGSYFKIIHKCDEETYCVQRLGSWYKLSLKLKSLAKTLFEKK